uniref:PHD-type domain-containing protein n=1 Tax=Panagrolaimus sp. JU765 TaxID=591449 RepID=A0AC34QLT1_9BILA
MATPISADTKVLKTPKLELKHDSGYSMETDEPTSEFSTSPLRSSGRQPIKARRLSPGVETSPTRSMIQSVCPSGVSIISSVDLKEMRKSKPGRPSNKDKKKMERQIAMQRKKLIKSGISQEGAIEFDINACHCICRQPYDPKKFYLACNRCKCWFHGKCVNITEKKAKRLPEWMCAECAPGGYSGMKKKKKTKQEVQFADEEDVDDNQLFCICRQTYDHIQFADEEDVDDNQLFCICRQTYDHSRNYIGCDGCNDWFHFECVGVTEEMSKRIKKYTCPLCEKKPSQLSRDEFAAMCAAVEAMAEDEQSLLFSSEAPEGQEFRETVPLQLFLNEICERVQSLHYKNFQEFVNEVATLQSAVMEHCGQESALPAAIQYLTNKASTTLLEHLPNHPALTG